MSQDVREQLSALMDGELDRDSARFLLRRVDADPALKAQWERMQWMRAALRRQTSLAAPAGFAARVMAEVEREAAPQRAPRFTGWIKYGTGGAIAAGVAVAALMLGRPADLPPAAVSAGVATTAPSAAPVVPAVSRPAGFNDNLVQPRPLVNAQAASYGSLEQPIGIDPRLQSYLVRHYEAAGGSGRSGVAPYVLLLVPASPPASRSEQPVSAPSESR
jgi:sigma-E factor negative regulatory protein RseA